MAEGQERQEALTLADVVDRSDAAQGEHDVRMGEHRPLRRAGSTARVDDRGDILGANAAGALRPRLKRAAQLAGATIAQGVEADNERVGAAAWPLCEDDGFEGRQLVARLDELA